MAKKLDFMYNPNTNKMVNEQKVKLAYYKVVEYLVDKAIQRSALK